MTPFKTPYGDIQVPSSYYDLTIENYNKIIKHSGEPVIVFSILTGLTVEQVRTIDFTDISESIKFLHEPIQDIEPSDIVSLNGVTYQLPQITVCEWGQKIVACEALNDPITVLVTYLQPLIKGKRFDPDKAAKIDLSALDTHSVLSASNFIKAQLIERLEVEGKMITPVISAEQKQAGIDNFDKLGIFNTIDMLAQGDPLKYDKILRLDYSTIFNKLLHSNISSNFDKKLNDIYNAKNR